MKRLSLRASQLGQLVGLANDTYRLVGDLLAQGGETHDPTGAFDKRQSKQSLKLAKTRRQGGLSDEAGLGGLSKVAVFPKCDKILELLQRRLMDRHAGSFSLIEISNQSLGYKRLERL
jgi:hypothetical protein